MISLVLEQPKAQKTFTMVGTIFTIAVVGIMSALALSTILKDPNDALSILARQTSLDKVKRFSYVTLT